MKLSTKLILYILGPCAAIYFIAVSIVSVNAREHAFEEAKKLADSEAAKYAEQTKSRLDLYVGAVRTLAQNFHSFDQVPEEYRRFLCRDMVRNLLVMNPEFISVWTTWEPYSIDRLDSLYQMKPGSSVLGNFGVMFYRQGDRVVLDESIEEDPEAVYAGDYYALPKQTRSEVVLDPYEYSYSRQMARILETSIVVPIVKEERFMGVAGIDVPLDKFQNFMGQLTPFGDGYAFLLSNNGTFVAHPNDYFVNRHISELLFKEEALFAISQSVREGKAFSFETVDSLNRAHYASVHPIAIGKTSTPWALGIAVPIETVAQKAQANYRISITVGLLGLASISVLIFFISSIITLPLKRMTTNFKRLALGDIFSAEKMRVGNADEIGETSLAMNQLVDNLRQTVDFANVIGQGNLNATLTVKGPSDSLGNALLQMRDSLRRIESENEERKERERRQAWVTTGIAKFSEILRQNNDNMEEFAFSITSNMVQYIGANIGAFYLIQDDDPDDLHVRILSAYAYERRKFLNNRVEMGTDLVGRCILENLSVFLTDVPPDYIKVTSGMGEHPPTCLLLVPLKTADQTFGCLELASFKLLEPFEIEFAERIAESVASTIATIKINLRTSKLLRESEDQAESLAMHEEQMRQNIEEMRITHEKLNLQMEESRLAEAAIKETEKELKKSLHFFNTLLDTIPYPLFYKDTEGVYLGCNAAFSDYIGKSKREVVGHTVFEISDSIEQAQEFHRSDQEVMRTGQRQVYETRVKYASGATKEVILNKSVFRDSQGEVAGMLGILVDKVQ